MIPLSSTRSPLLALILATTCLPAWSQTGPMVGTVKTTEARFLYRPGAVEKALRLSVLNASGQVVATSNSTSAAGNDYVAKFHTTGLSAATAYTYKVEDVSGTSPVLLAGPSDGLQFKTPMPPGAKGVITAAFASCANSTSEPVWQRIGELKVDQLFLCGDTPYIDTSDLASIRTKHRSFLETPFMSSLIRRTSSVGIWDDHDFGLNNGNGLSFAAGKPNTRQGFVEYRAHEQFGTGTEGIYHKIEIGSMEVFLLDPRWFSQTAASPVDPSQKTCFGAAQWQWIKDGLKASKAPFKVLAFGQVWQDKKNSETDDMFTYWYERDALFDFIRDEGIPGVVLLGGDIHVSRHLIHPQRVGYDLHDFITSPAHTSVIPSLDVAHPSLEWSSQQGRQFLTLSADTRSNPARLTARFMLHDGTVLREVIIPYDQLTPKKGSNLGLGLRAWWPFDGNLSNQSVLGSRLDGAAVNGTSLLPNGGLRGGAASFSRATQQYLRIPRSALDDNTASYTASLWCKPATLPAHGTTDRSFLMESTLTGAVSTDAGYSISVGFKADDTNNAKINLELHTQTLQPAVSTSTSPTPLVHGPFPCSLDRTLFMNRWAHVAVTFDGTKLKLYVDGTMVAEHVLPTPGPVSETGGLVIGGHRAGTGRNYDGLMDEVALWSRALTASEITDLHHAGTPQALPVEVTAIDTDGDTMEDWWERLHGLDSGNADDALADNDADQVPAWLEHQVGTNPQYDDSDLFDRIRDCIQPGSTSAPLVFRHPSQGTLHLKLNAMTSEDLEEWTSLVAETNAETSTNASEFTITIPATPNPIGFFKLSLVP